MRFLLLSALLLAASVACFASDPAPANSAWYEVQPLPEGDLLAELKLDLTRIAEALSSVPAFAPHSTSPAHGDKCFHCAHGVGEHVLGETLQLIDDACSKATCPVIKARCKWIEDNKEEFIGYLVVKIRPMHDGFIYCMGKGTCAHPNSTSANSLSSSFEVSSSSLLLPQLSASALFVARGLAEVFPVPASTTTDEPADTDAASSLDGSFYPLDLPASDSLVLTSRSRCHRCLHHSVRWVMKRSVRHLKHVCKHTSCPRMKKFCAWAKEHKKFVRGAIYAHVQPYKYAIGYCFGRGDCSQSTAHADITTLPFSMKGAKASAHETKPIIASKSNDDKERQKRMEASRKDRKKYY